MDEYNKLVLESTYVVHIVNRQNDYSYSVREIHKFI